LFACVPLFNIASNTFVQLGISNRVLDLKNFGGQKGAEILMPETKYCT